MNGSIYGGMTREQAEQAQKDTAAGKTVELPKQAVKLATTTFTTNKAGDYLISSSDEDKPVLNGRPRMVWIDDLPPPDTPRSFQTSRTRIRTRKARPGIKTVQGLGVP